MNASPLIALVGNPNAGKSALFNALTGAHQKTGNYPGVTVERHAGRLILPDGRPVELVDLPGTYTLTPASPDEQVTHDVMMGVQSGERRPNGIIIVVDATNLENHLRFALEVIALGIPAIIALNMVDMAERDGLVIDAAVLARELNIPVIATVAVRRRGIDPLKDAVATLTAAMATAITATVAATGTAQGTAHDFGATQKHALHIARLAIISETPARRITQSIDNVILHPWGGPLILAGLLFVMFQAVFVGATVPVAIIASAIEWLQTYAGGVLSAGLFRSLIVDGVIAGVGAVITFLPQILILFTFILILEMTGYMVRAAFLMDRLMARVGLSGRAFIPLLSSFACAIPGIMATRTIEDPKDRLTTILIAPLMTCSARLPVYAVIISAFIPPRTVMPGVGLQGLVLFGLYLSGIIGALIAALILRRTVTKGNAVGFMMEMPRYQWPMPRDLMLGLWQRAYIFLRRAGTIILGSTVILWLLLSFPRADPKSGISQIDASIAGHIANGLAVVVKPIGFNRDIALALIPAMAAREVAVSALATVYAVDSDDANKTELSLIERLRSGWSLPTALAFLAWFIFAPQRISTIAVVRRETNGWKWPLFMVGYLFALAYVAAGVTYWAAIGLGL